LGNLLRSYFCSWMAYLQPLQ